MNDYPFSTLEIAYETVPYDELEVGKVYLSRSRSADAWISVRAVCRSSEPNMPPGNWVAFVHLDGERKGRSFVKNLEHYFSYPLFRVKISQPGSIGDATWESSKK